MGSKGLEIFYFGVVKVIDVLREFLVSCMLLVILHCARSCIIVSQLNTVLLYAKLEYADFRVS